MKKNSLLILILLLLTFAAAENISLNVTPEDPAVGENITITLSGAAVVNTTSTLLEVVTPSARLRLLDADGTITFPVIFAPLEAGEHIFQLVDRAVRLILMETTVLVAEAPIIESPTQVLESVSLNITNVSVSKRKVTILTPRANQTGNETLEELSSFILHGKNRPSRTGMRVKPEGATRFESKTMGEMATIRGKHDVEMSFDGKTEKVIIRDCEFPQQSVLGLDDEAKPAVIEGKEASTYAIDPSALNFTNGTLTRVATGEKLWKCIEWDFENQECTGTWTFVKFITPGEPYDVHFDPVDPGYGETNLTILNVKSKPIVGNNWTVEFITEGTANLTIRASNGTTWSNTAETEDLKFLELTCGGTTESYAWVNNSVFIEDYSCNATGEEKSKVLTGGSHYIEFRFGDQVAYAENFAAATGILMLRNTAGGQNLNDQTNGVDITWSAQDRIDAIYAHNSGESNFTVATAGVYRISYGVTARQTGGGRIEDNARIYVNGTLQPACWGSSYTRGGNSVQDNIMTSDCLVELQGGEEIELNVLRTSSTTTTENSVGNQTWLHMQRINITNVFMAHDEAGGQTMNVVAGTNLTWDTEDREDSAFNFTTDANNVSILESGLYRITYGVAAEQGTDTRAATFAEILVNGSRIPVGYSQTNLRGFDSTRDGVVTADALVELGENAYVQIQAGRAAEASIATLATTANRSWFHIEKIPDDDANVIMVIDEVGGQDLDTTSGIDLDFDTVQRNDSFFNKTDSNTIRVLRAGYYRIAYNVYSLRDSGDTGATTRLEHVGNLRVNGADSDFCWSQGYNRGDQGTNTDSYEGANFASCIVNLSANSDLEIRITRTSSASAFLENVGNRTWWYIQALDAINEEQNVTLNVPVNDTITNQTPIDFNFTYVDVEDETMQCTLYANFTGSWVANTTIIAQNDTEENITLTPPDGNFIWNVECTDSFGVSIFAENNFTLRVDTAAPNISGENATSITANTAVIVWDTDENSNSTVQYGENESLGNFSHDVTLVTSHSVAISNLATATLYFYNVTSCDEAGNCNTTGPHNFTTTSTPDVTPPNVTDVIAFPGETEADILWNTSETANSSVEHNTTINLGIFTHETGFVVQHNVTITGLVVKTLYYFNVTSCDAAGNCNTTGTHNFTTVDLTPPTVTLVAPLNASSTDLMPNITFNVTDNYVPSNMTNCSLYSNFTGNWSSNQTLYNVTQGSNHTFETLLTPGDYVWNVLCYDEENLGAFATNNYTFTAVNAPMSISLVAPVDGAVLSDLTVTFNCTISDDYGIQNVSLYHNVSGSWTRNQTVNVTGKNVDANFSVAVPVGTYKWTCAAGDQLNVTEYASVNYTFIADNRTLFVAELLSKTYVMPGENLSVTGNVTLNDGTNVTYNELNVTLNGSRLNPENASEIHLIERNITPDWWDVDWKYRRALNITNTNATLALLAGTTINYTVDTETLVSQNRMLANGSDFRIVYWNGSANVELHRINATPFNDTATEVLFKTQVAIAADSSSTDYFIYYDNPDPGVVLEVASYVYSPLEVMHLEDVGASWQTVTMNTTYLSPVVVGQIEEAAVPPEEVSIRMTNVSATSFQIRLQNPGGNAFANRNISIFIMEEGQFVTRDGTLDFEGHLIRDETQVIGSGTSTPTTYSTINYNHTFGATPVLAGQIMSYKDSLWVDNHFNNVGTSSVQIALEMGQYCDQGGACPASEGHEPEDYGFIVGETGTGTIEGVPYEGTSFADIITGVDDGDGCFEAALAQVYSQIPVLVGDFPRRDGGDGGWMPTCFLDTTTVGFHTEEEDESDGERGHTAEPGMYMAIESEGILPLVRVSWAPTVAQLTEELRPTRTDGNASYNYTFSAPLIDGPYDLNVSTMFSIFSARNSSQFIVDGTAPFVNITNATPNPAELGVESVFVGWIATDLYLNTSYLNVSYPNGTFFAQYTSNETLTTTNLSVKGNWTLLAYAIDHAGNTNDTNETLQIIDTTPPVVGLNLPTNDSWVLTSDVFFNYTPTDFDAIANCTLYHNVSGWAANETNATVTNAIPNNFTVALPDEHVLWNVYCVDLEGNGGFSTNNFTMRIDTTPPLVNLEGPANNTLETTTNNIVFFFNTTDAATDIANCSVLIDGTQSGAADTTITEGTSQNITRFVANGEHNWSIQCSDTNAFTNVSVEYNITVQVDNETDPPIVQLNYPVEEDFVDTNNITFNYTVNDASGIENCSIIVDGILNQTNTTVTNNADNIFTIADFAEAKHNWSVQCYDNVTFALGTSSLRNFTVDLTDPVVTLNTLLNDSFSTASSVLLNYTPNDVNLANCTLYHNATGWSVNESDPSPNNNIPNNFTITYDDGPYLWNVLCYDLADRSSFAQFNYTVNIDTTIPSTTDNTTAPASPATYVQGQQYQFNITVVDTFPETVLIEHNFTGTLANYSSTDQGASIFVYNYTDLAVGTYVYKWYVNDSVGNENETLQYTYVVVQSQALVNLTLNDSEANLTIDEGQFANISARLINPGSGLLELYVNGARINNGSAPIENISQFPVPGTYNVSAIYNETQNYTAGITTWYIIVNDTNAPIVSLISPQNDTTVGTSGVVFSYNVTDTSAIVSCDLLINGTVNQTDTTITVNTTETFALSMEDGNYTWQVICYDTSNNGTSALHSFNVFDTTYLNVTIATASTYEQGEVAQINISTKDLFANSIQANATTAIIYTNTSVTDIPWWNESYTHRQLINITNTDADHIVEQNYSIQLSVNTSDPLMLANGSDIRIVYYHDTNATLVEIDRYNASPFNTSDTELWFTLQQDIPAGEFDDHYFLYYGNMTPGDPPENTSNVFMLFDDMQTGDLQGWVNHTTTGIAVVDEGGGNYVAWKAFNSDPGGGYKLLRESLVDYELRFRTNRINENGGASNRYGIVDGNGDGYGPRFDDFDTASGHIIEDRNSYVGNTVLTGSSVQLAPNTWYIWVMTKNASFMNFSAYNNTGEYITSVSGTDTGFDSVVLDRFQIFGGNEFYTDDVRVRMYMSNEPTAATGATHILKQVTENETNIFGEAITSYATFQQPLGNYSVVTLGERDGLDNGNGSTFFELVPDTIAPNITLELPLNNSWNGSAVVFTYYVDDINIDSCTLYHNESGWTANVSDSSPVHQANNTINTSFTSGHVLWNIECNDTFSNVAFASFNYTVRVDASVPVITLNAPGNDTNASSPVLFNWTVTDNLANFLNCSLTINGVVNETSINITEGNETIRNVSLATEGVANWSVACVDEAGNSGASELFEFFHLISPVNLTTYGNSTDVVINWSAVLGADSYNLYIQSNYSDRPSTPNVTGITDTNYTHTTSSDQMYYWVESARSTVTALRTQAGGKYTTVLPLNLSLVSFPLIPERFDLQNTTNIGFSFSTEPACAISLWRYNSTDYERTDWNGSVFTPASGSEGFTSLNMTASYWFESNTTCNNTFFGVVPVTTTRVGLVSGLNFMSWHTVLNQTLPTNSDPPLLVLSENNTIQAIDRFNSDTNVFEVTIHFNIGGVPWGWFPSANNPDFTTLDPTRGYVFDTTKEVNWTADPLT
ncbi:MAG: hypothetical protein OXR66_03685 [Candidatus Woesearchaeota archaeon]|nr:hypothetical protein [Candidatus Woesearchaeota archaeon]